MGDASTPEPIVTKKAPASLLPLAEQTASLAALLQTAVGVIPTGITISDMRQPDQPLVYVNSGFEQLTGYTAQEVIGRNCRFLQGKEREQDALPMVRKTLANGEACTVILRNYRKDGVPFWNELTLYPLVDEQGHLTHYVGVQHDISAIVERSRRLVQGEKQATQEAIQQAQSVGLLNEMSRQLNGAVSEEEIFQIAAHYAPQIIEADRISIALLVDEGRQFEIIALQGMAGALSQGVRLPLADTDIERAIQSEQLFVQANRDEPSIGGMNARMNAPLITGGVAIGALNVVASQAAAFTQRDEQLLVQIANLLASTIQNRRLFAQTQAALDENRQQNSALRQALEALQQAQTQLLAAEKMASLGRLVAGLAHEINTPVGIAITAVSVLADRTQEVLQLYRNGQVKRTDFEEFLQLLTASGKLITNNLNRATELIQSFKQVAVDQSSEAARTINLKAYIGEVVNSLQPELKRTQLTVAIKGDETIVLQSYPGALSQIITNLVLNSIIHGYPSDTVGRLTITLQRQADKVCLHYADDGVGIPPEHQHKIFEPFFTTRRGQGGSGLGLHIVYNLVTQKLGGTISFQSQVGSGTTFTITLPLQN
ncbi:MAG: PAS domain-containing protein [Caldilinea sp. CFX5]|nr:PAS domain-containing protein [Caldilinea sp. CFX5]